MVRIAISLNRCCATHALSTFCVYSVFSGGFCVEGFDGIGLGHELPPSTTQRRNFCSSISTRRPFRIIALLWARPFLSSWNMRWRRPPIGNAGCFCENWLTVSSVGVSIINLKYSEHCRQVLSGLATDSQCLAN